MNFKNILTIEPQNSEHLQSIYSKSDYKRYNVNHFYFKEYIKSPNGLFQALCTTIEKLKPVVILIHYGGEFKKHKDIFIPILKQIRVKFDQEIRVGIQRRLALQEIDDEILQVVDNDDDTISIEKLIFKRNR
ncbi:hypothetical protein JW960_02950 [candidate division KSB1 bacterium]|nr:hypothetical protein [candidate division KSB1 bacterium]